MIILNWLVNGPYSLQGAHDSRDAIISNALASDLLGGESTIVPVAGMVSAGKPWQILTQPYPDLAIVSGGNSNGFAYDDVTKSYVPSLPWSNKLAGSFQITALSDADVRLAHSSGNLYTGKVVDAIHIKGTYPNTSTASASVLRDAKTKLAAYNAAVAAQAAAESHAVTDAAAAASATTAVAAAKAASDTAAANAAAAKAILDQVTPKANALTTANTALSTAKYTRDKAIRDATSAETNKASAIAARVAADAHVIKDTDAANAAKTASDAATAAANTAPKTSSKDRAAHHAADNLAVAIKNRDAAIVAQSLAAAHEAKDIAAAAAAAASKVTAEASYQTALAAQTAAATAAATPMSKTAAQTAYNAAARAASTAASALHAAESKASSATKNSASVTAAATAAAAKTASAKTASDAAAALAATNGVPWDAYEYIDITKYMTPIDRAVYYAYVNVYSPSNQSCRMLIRSDDDCRVWLNHAKVYGTDSQASFKGRLVSDAVDKTNVYLNTGWNQLMVKVVNSGGPTGFAVCFADSYDAPLTNLIFSADASSTVPQTNNTSTSTTDAALMAFLNAQPTSALGSTWRPGMTASEYMATLSPEEQAQVTKAMYTGNSALPPAPQSGVLADATDSLIKSGFGVTAQTVFYAAIGIAVILAVLFLL